MIDTTRPATTVAGKHEHQQQRLVVAEQIAACRRCTMCMNGNGPVPFHGPTPNDIMIVGEAPTRTDDRQGRLTHSGEPGLLLRQLLARFDLDLDTLCMVNAVQCWPEKPALDRHLFACAPNLRSVIRLCDPLIVLSLGSVALKVTSDRPRRTITRDHGVPFRSQAGPFVGRWVFPTTHPAAIKHTPGAVTALSADFAAFARLYAELVASR